MINDKLLIDISNLLLKDDDLHLHFKEIKPVSEPDTNIFAFHFSMQNTMTREEMGGINIKAGYTENIEKDVTMLHEQGIETGEIVQWSGARLENALAENTEYADPPPKTPKLLGCMMPSEKWKAVRFNDPDGIVLEIWQRL